MAVLKREEILDDWSVLIGSAQGKAEEVFTATRELIAETKVPNVAVDRKGMSPGVIRGLFGTTRNFLVVTEKGNRRLRPYQMYINARDYGTNLAVDWYLMYRSGRLVQVLAAMSAIPFFGLLVLPFAAIAAMGQRARERRGGLDLDLFDTQDLRTYVTNAHHCLLGSVDKLMVSLNQDPSKLERKSRGFLGIS